MIQKLKKRIKRALAAFLKEELMEFIGYENIIPPKRFSDWVSHEYQPSETMDTLVSSTIVPFDLMEIYQRRKDPFVLSKIIEEGKEKLLREASRHIHVDCTNLVDETYNPMNYYLRMVLRVQKKQRVVNPTLY